MKDNSPSLAQLCSAMKGVPLQGGFLRGFKGASIDTRTLNPGAVFFAMRGARTDGHRFVARAARAGAAAAVVERRAACPARFPLIRVASAAQALRAGASWYRRRFFLPVVGITGSNGKTTVKDMTAFALDSLWPGQVLATLGNLNNLLGVPLNLFRLRPSVRAAVLEMAMNRPGEIRELARIAAPGIGVLLNVGPAHLWRFRSVSEIADNKADLLRALPGGGWAVLNADDPTAWRTRTVSAARVLGFGVRRGEIRAERPKMDSRGRVRFVLRTPGGDAPVRLSVPGRHNAANAAAAAAICWILGEEPRRIAAALSRFSPSMPMRLEERRFKSGARAIVDCYNANPASCQAAFSYLRDTGAKRPILVLGEMLELGRHSAREHRAVGAQAAALRPRLLVGVGAQARELVRGARRHGAQNAIWVRRAESAMPAIAQAVHPGSAVLFKASRRVGLEGLVAALASSRGGTNAV